MAGSRKRRCGRVVITRPQPDAQKSGERLRELGFEVVIEPVLEIEPLMGTKPQIIAALTRKPQAILITSANGIRVLAEHTNERDIRIITVGDSSADLAKNKGFKEVESACGDVGDLAEFVLTKLKPDEGFLLHVAGKIVAGNLQKQLEEKGFEVQCICAYDARAVESFSSGIKVALANCEIDLVIFYSARTAKIFEELMKKERIEYLAGNIEVFSLSPATEWELDWKKCHIAEQSNEDSLLQLIDYETSDTIRP